MARNIWGTGVQIANNPSLWTRMKHSSKGTSFRRGAKLSTPFKVLAGGAKFVLKQVPIPILNDILGVLSDKAYAWGKSKQYAAHHAATKSAEERVKFGWKDMDVQDMDRYRWKVHASFLELQKLAQAFSHKQQNFVTEGSICDDFVKVTTEAAYTRKRIDKLREKALAIAALCALTNDWLNDCDAKLEQWTTDNKEVLNALFEKAGKDAHMYCDDTVCVMTTAEKARFTHGSAAANAAWLGAVVSEALDPTAFFKMSTPDLPQVKVNNMYSGQKYD